MDNFDEQLEKALVIDAVYDYPRFMAYGVGPEDFASEKCKRLVVAAAAAWETGTVGLEGVGRALQAQGGLAWFGGLEGVTLELRTNGVADPERLRSLRRLRDLQKAAAEVSRHAGSGNLHEALAVLTEAQRTAADTSPIGKPLSATDLSIDVLTRLQDTKRSTKLVHPGFEYMAKAVGLIPSGSMLVLGGGTNVGKSGFSLEMLMAIAEVGNGCGGYVSVEDPPDVLSSRFVGSTSGVSSRDISQGNISRDEFNKIAKALNAAHDVYHNKLWFSFAVGGNDLDICACMSKLAARGCRIIVVDYVQAIESSKRQQDRRNEIRWLASRLKAHAQRLDIVLVLVSQLSRPPKGEEGREPSKHDLKEAGDLENAAEYVVLLWRQAESDSSMVNVKLAKSKYGAIGTTWQMRRAAPSWRLREVEHSLKLPVGFGG